MSISRRRFLFGTLGASLSLAFGCAQDDDADAGGGSSTNNATTSTNNASTGTNNATTSANNATTSTNNATTSPENNANPVQCHDAFAGGVLLATMPFVGEDERPFGTLRGAGHDGRRVTDLRAIDQGVLTIPNDAFYIRTFYPDQLDPAQPWRITVGGLVSEEVVLSMDDLTPRVEPQGNFVMECSGNTYHSSFGLLSAADWSGVSLLDVLQDVDIAPEATRVLVSGFDSHTHVSTHSQPTASWVFTFEEIERAGGFLATEMNGAPLPPNHGAPVRLFMPGWYGCCNIKWVDEIRLVDDSEPATSQMQEFARRTHQPGIPALARDYIPATMDQAAMPVRVEKWQVDGALLYRIIGIMWGGDAPTDALQIRFGADQSWEDVDVCPPQAQNAGWTIWQHAYAPSTTGDVRITLRVNDPDVRTRRLDTGHYARTVTFDEA